MDLTWLTDALQSTADAYGTVKAADALNHPQVSPNGVQYTNGQFQVGSGVSSTLLLVGAGVLLFLFMKD